ncbi:MAG: hypothetical protein US60_C0013G0015 [Microgenomates group bacterium GW2011_GWC1_37_8]|uniref:Uncharacterized protein n=1 Tax=Candidatus Woesebacteria bacterium GW2011_GWB1_38_8 TaxID=1618570 RepID=A0A0G0P4T6_9BACT|nr:MAG: hypothetical protein US60_C0013G0015 [Microgenomates group bacterium GW2011_GWC1_37_8]KKQ84326.1 MAG: hypothetical protein UT08_C0019G0020 [Candidatus Woesebacteria bacterium GW2011_GWB1_38_8]
MPPEFNDKLSEHKITYQKLEGDRTRVDGHPPYPQGISDASQLFNLLLSLANETDAKLSNSEGDHFDFEPRK